MTMTRRINHAMNSLFYSLAQYRVQAAYKDIIVYCFLTCVRFFTFKLIFSLLLYLFSKLPTIPETVLKKRKRLEQIKASRAKALLAQKKVFNQLLWVTSGLSLKSSK